MAEAVGKLTEKLVQPADQGGLGALAEVQRQQGEVLRRQGEDLADIKTMLASLINANR
jgi:hypothetical protein